MTISIVGMFMQSEKDGSVDGYMSSKPKHCRINTDQHTHGLCVDRVYPAMFMQSEKEGGVNGYMSSKPKLSLKDLAQKMKFRVLFNN